MNPLHRRSPAASIPPAPFLDPAWRPLLYGSADRLAARTQALHAARTAGRPAEQVIADLASSAGVLPGGIVADIGCGRGTTTLRLAEQLHPAVVLAVDLSPALLTAARHRLRGHTEVQFVCGDFHRLPLHSGSCHLTVAAFCLYHSSRPAAVIAELARCLTSCGVAVLTSKSIDSYRHLDELIAASGLDPNATSRPSLYTSAHSANLARLAGAALDIVDVVHEIHRFRFRDLGHAARYLATSPKYDLPHAVRQRPGALADALRWRLPDGPVIATSTVTYVVARLAGSA